MCIRMHPLNYARRLTKLKNKAETHDRSNGGECIGWRSPNAKGILTLLLPLFQRLLLENHLIVPATHNSKSPHGQIVPPIQLSHILSPHILKSDQLPLPPLRMHTFNRIRQ